MPRDHSPWYQTKTLSNLGAQQAPFPSFTNISAAPRYVKHRGKYATGQDQDNTKMGIWCQGPPPGNCSSMKGPKAIFLKKSKRILGFHSDLMVQLQVAIDPKLIIGSGWPLRIYKKGFFGTWSCGNRKCRSAHRETTLKRLMYHAAKGWSSVICPTMSTKV